MVTTLAGLSAFADNVDGAGANARFHGLQGVALDNTRNLYLADPLNQTDDGYGQTKQRPVCHGDDYGGGGRAQAAAAQRRGCQ
jgi:hypothetical protein